MADDNDTTTPTDEQGMVQRCREFVGMDVFAAVLPDVAAQTAASIAVFART